MTVYRVQGEAGKRLEAALRNLDKKVAKVGWFAGARYPDEPGKPGLPVAQVAYQNEVGNPSKHIPARPFISPTIREKQESWANIAESGARAVLQGRRTITEVLEGIGLRAAGDIRKTIATLTTPPLAESTIRARAARRGIKNGDALVRKKLSGAKLTAKETKSFGLLDKPLIDTRHMYVTLTNVVEDA